MDTVAARADLLRRLVTVPRTVLIVLLSLLVGVTLWTFRPSPQMRHVTAYFDRTVALYPGSEVKILGVSVGTVDSIDPQGDRVKVEMSYEARYDVPADAKAVIISPAIVGDRYVQLTPAYVSGARLADGAMLGLDRTAAPVELDTIYKSIDELSVALGPNGANKTGALNDLLGVAARNLDGNGATLRQTLHDVGLLTGTLSDNKTELFDTVDQLDRFVAMLAHNDSSIRGFNRDLAQVSGVLSDERHDLARALDNLGTALNAVSQFVDDNGDVLAKNVRGLAKVTRTLVKQRDALDQALHVAPLALNNLYLAYNPKTGTLDQRSNIGENINQLINDPSLVLCAIVEQAGNPASACDAIKSLLDTLPPLGQPSGLPTTGPPTEVEHVDPTLGGLFGGGS
jgi:phospholipid/cholesterol/gamma-HCH transport system substrate-binding protein